MVKFFPVSPDPYLNKDTDMAPAKFGHLNALLANVRREFANNVDAINGGLKPGELYSTPTGEVRIVK